MSDTKDEESKARHDGWQDYVWRQKRPIPGRETKEQALKGLMDDLKENEDLRKTLQRVEKTLVGVLKYHYPGPVHTKLEDMPPAIADVSCCLGLVREMLGEKKPCKHKTHPIADEDCTPYGCRDYNDCPDNCSDYEPEEEE